MPQVRPEREIPELLAPRRQSNQALGLIGPRRGTHDLGLILRDRRVVSLCLVVRGGARQVQFGFCQFGRGVEGNANFVEPILQHRCGLILFPRL